MYQRSNCVVPLACCAQSNAHAATRSRGAFRAIGMLKPHAVDQLRNLVVRINRKGQPQQWRQNKHHQRRALQSGQLYIFGETKNDNILFDLPHLTAGGFSWLWLLKSDKIASPVRLDGNMEK